MVDLMVDKHWSKFRPNKIVESPIKPLYKYWLFLNFAYRNCKILCPTYGVDFYTPYLIFSQVAAVGGLTPLEEIEKNILDYDPNQKDEIRRIYLQRGPTQPRGHSFPYNEKADKAYCLWCYFFRDQVGKQCGSDAFVTDGFCNWNKKKEDLMSMRRQSDIEKKEYRIRLQGSLDAVRYILHNSLSFRGHNESEDSIYRGIFSETLKLISCQNENAGKAMLKAPKNCKLTSPDIQKDIVDYFAKEELKSIFEELERFVVVIHVKDTYAGTLKSAINSLFAEHKVSLKQLVVVAMAKHHDGVGDFFDRLALVVTMVSSSCKRKDMIREFQKERLEEEIANGEVETGTGKNHELFLVRAGDTRWGSHHNTMLSLKSLFPEVVKVLQFVKNEGDNALSRRQASEKGSKYPRSGFVGARNENVTTKL
ncbi:uncharacterized protein [Rutidosis leptorrhynchoides]|uniref:uncharacterized protein n=1 Tax=Rutidosis leptorrhynchoides TaxID=125765 RepID=UPI003A99C408